MSYSLVPLLSGAGPFFLSWRFFGDLWEWAPEQFRGYYIREEAMQGGASSGCFDLIAVNADISFSGTDMVAKTATETKIANLLLEFWCSNDH